MQTAAGAPQVQALLQLTCLQHCCSCTHCVGTSEISTMGCSLNGCASVLQYGCHKHVCRYTLFADARRPVRHALPIAHAGQEVVDRER